MNFPLLPATVVAAVVLFVLKETLEGVRRSQSDERRRSALKALLARECELNHWTIKNLSRAISTAESERTQRDATLAIIFRRNGQAHLRMARPDGSIHQIWVPSVHRDALEKHLVEIATLDKKLFAVAEPALSSLADLVHVRDSMLEYISEEPEHLDGFSEYAISEIAEALDSVKELYRACTKRELSAHRLR